MEQQPSKQLRPNLSKAIFEVQQEIAFSLDADSNNSHVNSKFASLKAVYKCVRSALRKVGVMVRHDKIVYPEHHEQVLCTILEHVESGETYESRCFLKPEKPSLYGWGGCETYMKRYTLCSMLGITIGEQDDDGQEEALYIKRVSEFRALISSHAPHLASAIKEEFKFSNLKDLGDAGLLEVACYIIRNLNNSKKG